MRVTLVIHNLGDQLNGSLNQLTGINPDSGLGIDESLTGTVDQLSTVSVGLVMRVLARPASAPPPPNPPITD